MLICPSCFAGGSIDRISCTAFCLPTTDKDFADCSRIMDDHFFHSSMSDPSKRRWSDLRHSDDDPMEGPSNYGRLADHSSNSSMTAPLSQQTPHFMRVDNDQMDGPTRYRVLGNLSPEHGKATSLSSSGSVLEHGDNDPMEGSSNYKALEDQHINDTARSQSQRESINQLHANDDAMTALDGDRVSWEPGTNHDDIAATSQSPTRGHRRHRKMSMRVRASQHISQMRLSKPSTWFPRLGSSNRSHSPGQYASS